jgi:hypothetical protein
VLDGFTEPIESVSPVLLAESCSPIEGGDFVQEELLVSID